MTKQEREKWENHIQEVAEDNGLTYAEADALFDMLGPNEAHDGFITMAEDMAAQLER